VLSLACFVKEGIEALGAAHPTGAGLLGFGDLGLESELRFLSYGRVILGAAVGMRLRRLFYSK
jgi:hypothetical protein